jgi:Protein of unknown function (DUF3307).
MDIVFVLLLLGHILGDFYFQTNKMAEKKPNSDAFFILHIVEYSLCMGIVLFIGIPWSYDLFFLWLFSSVLHLIVDLIKRTISKHFQKNAFIDKLRKRSFIIDQTIHIISLICVWLGWGLNLSVRPFVEQKIDNLPEKPILMILCILCILRPVGILIGKGEIWDFNKQKSQPEESTRNAGKMIGYLERIIVCLFLMYQQYSAIAFVLTAKSVARFKEIENNKSMAEYYLIGTLLSVVSAFVITLLLGLCG